MNFFFSLFFIRDWSVQLLQHKGWKAEGELAWLRTGNKIHPLAPVALKE